uniref:NADH-ubiquinone oxidoreductase chain 4 n=1 Tax=Gari togata TaxID=2774046 RepID=A0A8K0Z4N9_9BIVA|nr:NADH dehydrogenase subunit 4 [Gari togata]
MPSWCFLVSLSFMGSGLEGMIMFSVILGLDWMGGSFVTMSIFVGVLSVLCMEELVSGDSTSWGFVVVLFSVVMFSVLSFLSVNFLVFLFCFESSLIPMSVMILCWGYQPERVQALLQLVLYAFLGGIPTLVSVVSVCGLESSVNMEVLHVVSASRFNGGAVSWFLLMAGMLVKVPLFFFHGWLTKAHVEAPSSGSMILSGVLLKVGVFGIWRVMYSMKGVPCGLVQVLVVVSLWGGLVCSLVCLSCYDVKLVVAYSSVSHMAMVLAGLLMSSSIAWYGSLCISVIHGFCSACMFMMAGVLYSVCGSRSSYLCKGISKLSMMIYGTWFLLCSVNMSAPPFAAFFGECFLVAGIFGLGSALIGVVLLLCIIMSGVYNTVLFGSVCHGSGSSLITACEMWSVRGVASCWSGMIMILVFSTNLFILLGY